MQSRLRPGLLLSLTQPAFHSVPAIKTGNASEDCAPVIKIVHGRTLACCALSPRHPASTPRFRRHHPPALAAMICDSATRHACTRTGLSQA